MAKRSIAGVFDVHKIVRGEQGGSGGAKSRLLNAARLFGQNPLHEVGVSQILKDAGVQPPTLYHHFGDKEGLFVSWATIAVDRLGQDIASTCQNAATQRQSLEGIAANLSNPHHPDVIQLLRDAEKLERPESREAIVEAVQRAIYEPLIGVFLMAMENGSLRRDPVHKSVAAFLSATHSLRPSGLLPASSEDDNLAWIVDRFLHGFAPKAQTR